MPYRYSLLFHVVVIIAGFAVVTCSAHATGPAQQHLEQGLMQVLEKQKTIGLAVGIVQNGQLAYGFGSMKLGDAKPKLSGRTFEVYVEENNNNCNAGSSHARLNLEPSLGADTNYAIRRLTSAQ